MASLVPWKSFLSRIAFVLIAACSLTIFGQSLSEALAKAPPDIEAALEARVQQFYGFLAEGKFREAEALVAVDTKDRYYSSDKDQIEDFKIVKIVYHENFTKANIVAVRSVNWAVPLAGQTVKLKATFTSYWKIENGLWCWFLQPEAEFLETPYGKMRNPKFGGKALPAENVDVAAATKQAQINATVLMQQATTGVRADSNTLELRGKAAKGEISLTNKLPGAVKLRLEAASIPGLELRLEKDTLGSNETTRLVAHYVPGPKAHARQPLSLVVRVEPTGQVISITLNFAPSPKS
ncbi:MAG: hypothetical protein NTY38_13120 [Acidobacteria bacterium]|nr:hypothetical protein [Acidobacteriota bacterium]